MIIAIDGPAGAGKSTIAKILSKELNMIYLDTGAMYRACGLKAFRNGVDLADHESVENMLKTTAIAIGYTDGVIQVYLDGDNVSADIRKPEISKMASDISAIPAVRYAMVEMQRKLASNADTILDGRDIGTFVLPNADVKIFLTASVEERAARRYKELQQKGIDTDIETVKREIEQRDYNDSHRALAPLKKADDAVEVDTTGLNIEQVCEKIIAIVRA